jgi:hypothetical protein
VISLKILDTSQVNLFGNSSLPCISVKIAPMHAEIEKVW